MGFNSAFKGLMFAVQIKSLFSTNIENHNIDTRQRNNFYLPQANVTIYQKGAYFKGIKIFNNLSLEIKNVHGNKKSLKLL
jgi:ABC-type transporter Mla maintaining outer membrane lipid asymmetry ATPase subunit MlaF